MSSPNPEDLTLINDNVKLDTSVVEQLVMAAVASLSPATNTTTTAITNDTQDNTPSTITPAPELLNFTDVQLEQINAVQAQAIAQAAALVNGTSAADYQQLFANFEVPATSNIAQPKRETITQKVRKENRERKKRWRQQNQERNKDNDLRCRVNKRAHKLFGKEDSPHKQKWVDEEFIRRRLKRKEKETRKLDPSSSLSPQPNHEELSNLLTDPYISMLANNISNFTEKDDKSEQFTTQLLEFLQQQQQNHDFANDNTTTTPTTNTTEDTEMMEEKKEEEIKVDDIIKSEPMEEVVATPEQPDEKPVDYPMDAVLTLMQLNAGWRQ